MNTALFLYQPRNAQQIFLKNASKSNETFERLL